MTKPNDRSGVSPYINSDPAHWDFQYLEDVATGYWYAQVLFTAVELNLFGGIEAGCADPVDLAARTGCEPDALSRLLAVLHRLDLIHQSAEGLCNSQLARRFLVPGEPDYMGDFILYRSYMQAGWRGLTARLAGTEAAGRAGRLDAESDYVTRNFYYVRAMDRLARLKAREIIGVLNHAAWRGPVLDIGGGAGALSRALVRSQAKCGRRVSATLFELPEVVAAARRIYPDAIHWKDLDVITGDFRHHVFPENYGYKMVVVSNFLHAYGPETARDLLFKAAALTAPDGILLIHDYFPDRCATRPHKGALYDLNMLLNTFDGGCQPAETISVWLKAAGMAHLLVHDLGSDSSIMLAGRFDRIEKTIRPERREGTTLDRWVAEARRVGFAHARLIRTDQIRTAQWSREKCRFGCSGYGQNHMCPPGGIDHTTMTQMLDAYSWALLVTGSPPAKIFHHQLLALEKSAFLSGLHKTLAFGAGPCPVCTRCASESGCRHPDLARPSMEGSGIDVYTTARNSGIRLEPPTVKGRYVKYVGMVLLK